MRKIICALFMLVGNPFGAANLAVLSVGYAVAQQPTDPNYWCNISRSQVSQERDASLAQIEALKMRNAAMETRIKELEAAAKAKE